MMKPTTRRQPSLERRAAEQLRALAKPHRFRVRLDVEGFPVIPARYGQIEWFDGADTTQIYASIRPPQLKRAMSFYEEQATRMLSDKHGTRTSISVANGRARQN